MVLHIMKRTHKNPLDADMVMKICLAVSLLVHTTLFLALQGSFSMPQGLEEVRSYSIELIRPPIEAIEISARTDEKNLLPNEPADPLNDQETVSLETKDKKYTSFFAMIKQSLMQHWKYPPEARSSLIEGTLTALFSLERNGKLIEASIIQTSGYSILDNEAARAINSAAPFPPFPESITVSRLNILATFDYRLTSKR